MTWKALLASGDVQGHVTSRQEIDNMRKLIRRDLADAAVPGLSPDRRFATAYNAALQAGNMAIACAGYRVTSRMGHHRVSIECTRLALGNMADDMMDYLETCRRKRNAIDYTQAQIATDTEAREILEKAGEFHALVERWIANHHGALAL